MPAVLRFIDEERARAQATIVHCYYGCDRTGSVLGCYLVAREGCTAAQAVARVQHSNPEALWALGYAEVIATFEELYRKDPSQFEVERA
jgi:protein-tyrosine phosphatase